VSTHDNLPEPKPDDAKHASDAENASDRRGDQARDDLTFEQRPPTEYKPGMVVGVLGGGQLGQMLALAGLPLGVRFRFFDPERHSVARHVGELVVGEFHDRAAVEAFAKGCDVVTYEFENVLVDAAHWADLHTLVHPSPIALAVGQDRAQEKKWFERVGLAVAPYALVEHESQLREAFQRLHASGSDAPSGAASVDSSRWPAGVVIKTCKGGYDGKGQVVVRSEAELPRAWQALCEQLPSAKRMGSNAILKCIMERLVPFESEVSIIAVRAQDGEFDTYPLTRNTHKAGILRRSSAPAEGVAPDVHEAAIAAARELTACFGYAGVLAIELFVVGGKLLANEFAPRVHNSGHWTQDGSITSQFENHVRAICGLPLAPTAMRPGIAACDMVNLIGAQPPVQQIACLPAARVHMYGKEPRAGRKLGHVNCVGPSHKIAKFQADRVAALLAES
jgi:5-(carboxyamino)imidazole ribonucleotide synthase